MRQLAIGALRVFLRTLDRIHVAGTRGEFAITDGSTLAYHSDAMDHESFRYWFERLYGVPLISWYDHSRPKDGPRGI